MQSHSPPQLQRYLTGMLSLCFLLGGVFFTPATTKAATLYTNFATWAANAGTITNTSQFDWYEYGGIGYPALMFSLEEGTTWKFADSIPRSLQPGEQPHDGLGNYLWGGNPDAHAFSTGLSPGALDSPASTITLQIELPNDIVAGGVWITVRRNSDLRFTFAGIENPLVLGTRTTQFIGWVGQDMTAIEISLVELTPGIFHPGSFYIGDFFEGTGPTPVPEPGPLLLLALGFLALLAARRTPHAMGWENQARMILPRRKRTQTTRAGLKPALHCHDRGSSIPAYSTALTMSSITFLASPNTIMVLSM